VKKKDNKALFLIHRYVDNVHFEKIQNATTTKERNQALIPYKCYCYILYNKII